MTIASWVREVTLVFNNNPYIFQKLYIKVLYILQKLYIKVLYIFEIYKKMAYAKGFLMVASSPLTRSSYHASEDFALLKKIRNKDLSSH